MSIWTGLIGGFVRWALTVLLAYLVGKGIINAETAAEILGQGTVQITTMILIFLPLFWSFAAKIINKNVTKVALAAAPSETLAEVEQEVVAEAAVVVGGVALVPSGAQIAAAFTPPEEVKT